MFPKKKKKKLRGKKSNPLDNNTLSKFVNNQLE